MLEILIVISLSRNIAAKAREKGRSGGLFVFLLVTFWIVGELLGAVIAGVASMVALNEPEPNLPLCYAGALAGAILGAVSAFLIVKLVAPVRPHDEDVDEDYDRRDTDRY